MSLKRIRVYTKTIAHFRVHLSLFIKARPGAQPFMWKWVKFACEWNLISIWKDEHQDSLWERGLKKFGNGLFNHWLYLDFYRWWLAKAAALSSITQQKSQAPNLIVKYETENFINNSTRDSDQKELNESSSSSPRIWDLMHYRARKQRRFLQQIMIANYKNLGCREPPHSICHMAYS